MKRIFLALACLIGFAIPVFPANFHATGLTNPDEDWYYFGANVIYVNVENYGGFTVVDITVEIAIRPNYNGQMPSNQPFELVWTLSMPEGAVINYASMRSSTGWIEAVPADVHTAESTFDDATIQKPRFLLRQQVLRDYSSNQYSRFEIRCSPLTNSKPVTVNLNYIIANVPSLWAMRTEILLNEFIPWSYYYYEIDHTKLVYFQFRDRDFSDSQPFFIYGLNNSLTFTQSADSWWKATTTLENVWSSSTLGLVWWRTIHAGQELRLFEQDGTTYFHLMMLPPLTANDRNPRRVLLVYDLGFETAADRNQLIADLKAMAESGLADIDSINVLLTDFTSKTLRSRFIPATDANIAILFNEIKNSPQPQISALPQLLRAAKNFFNSVAVSGEIWLISDADQHSNPASMANEIIDLSLRQMQVPVVFRIFDCSYGQGYTSVNGIYYYGNQYLYQNLARLSNGSVVEARSVQSWYLLDALVDLLMPAVDIVEVDPFPTSGYSSSRYLLNAGRTHFPITYPYRELSRYTGELPFSTDFYGEVDGSLFWKNVAITDTIATSNTQFLATMWHYYHVGDLLQQPQSYATIEEIGDISRTNHFVSPYCGFVIPSPSGYAGFKRLVDLDTVGNDDSHEVFVPRDFTMQAYPNPFNLQTTLQLDFTAAGEVRIVEVQILDVLGRLVKQISVTIPVNQTQVSFTWNGSNDAGQTVASGIYLVSARLNQERGLVKLTLLK